MPRTGRPRSFDRDAAVTSATHLFWQHGYEGVSLDQLRTTMGGISSASFYAAFGSKEALYREALSVYLATYGRVTDALRDQTLPPRDRIEHALRRSAMMQTTPGHPTGCMVTLSATIGSDQTTALKGLTAAERQANREAIVLCVTAAIENGTLPANVDTVGLAAMFDGFLLGISLLARDGMTGDVLNGAITNAMRAWDVLAIAPR